MKGYIEFRYFEKADNSLFGNWVENKYTIISLYHKRPIIWKEGKWVEMI